MLVTIGALRGIVTRISQISSQTCAKIIGSQLYRCPIVFEHLEEHINVISLRENKPRPFSIDLMSTC